MTDSLDAAERQAEELAHMQLAIHQLGMEIIELSRCVQLLRQDVVMLQKAADDVDRIQGRVQRRMRRLDDRLRSADIS